MAKTGDPKKADKKSASKPATKPAPKPAQTKTAKNPGAKSPPPAAKLASKPPAKPAKPVAAKAAAPRADGGEHSAQAEHMRALYEKLHGSAEQRANIPGQNLPGKKKGGFDPQQFRGHQRGFGGGGAMIRRTQGRGGGSGGGGSGGGGA